MRNNYYVEIFNRIDRFITGKMAKYGISIMRISLGIIFFWFGFLKFFPGVSDAENIATVTMTEITFGAIKPSTALFLLALWECVIGVGLIAGKFLRLVLLLLFLQLLGTFTPLLLFPGEMFSKFPYVPTIEGQYIIKNLILISAGIIIGSTVRGGRFVAEK